MNTKLFAAIVLGFAASAGAASAQTTASVSSPPPATPAATAPEPLKLYFASGSAAVRSQDTAVLDQAARLFRAGNPIVMVVSGAADTVGRPDANLRLSQQRAETVLQGLVARGIPVERFQILAKGETEASGAGRPTADEQSRRVEISWR